MATVAEKYKVPPKIEANAEGKNVNIPVLEVVLFHYL